MVASPGRPLMTATSNAQASNTRLPSARLPNAATSGRDENQPDVGSLAPTEAPGERTSVHPPWDPSFNEAPVPARHLITAPGRWIGRATAPRFLPNASIDVFGQAGAR